MFVNAGGWMQFCPTTVGCVSIICRMRHGLASLSDYPALQRKSHQCPGSGLQTAPSRSWSVDTRVGCLCRRDPRRGRIRQRRWPRPAGSNRRASPYHPVRGYRLSAEGITVKVGTISTRRYRRCSPASRRAARRSPTDCRNGFRLCSHRPRRRHAELANHRPCRQWRGAAPLRARGAQVELLPNVRRVCSTPSPIPLNSYR